jgi:hypothetical protein
MYRNKARTIPQSCAGVSRHSPTGAINLPTRADPLGTALQSTVTGDIYSRICDPKDLHGNFPAYAAWMYKGFPGEAPAQVLREHDNYVAQAMKNRTVLIAGDDDDDDGDAYLDIASVEARPRDWVRVLLGETCRSNLGRDRMAME